MSDETLADRADWGFGKLLEWHVKRGTRPEGQEKRKWIQKEFAGKAGWGSAGMVGFWYKEEHLPETVDPFEIALLGKETRDDRHAEFRQELRQKFLLAKSELKLEKNSEELSPDEVEDESQGTVSAATYEEKAFISNIVTSVPTHFVGHEMLDVIETALKRNKGQPATVALHGLSGVGKTTLAVAYAARVSRSRRIVWRIGAHTELGMRTSLLELGSRLGWVAAEDKEEEALAAVKDRLLHEGEGILLIYDSAANVKTLKPYLPIGGAAQIIVTSNNHAWRKIATPIEIPIWQKNAGADFLTERSGQAGTRAAAEALSEALGGLALAHEMAAAFCEQCEISLAEYNERFDKAPIKFLDGARYVPAEYGLTVARTFELAIHAATQLYPASEHLIVCAALSAPEPIPLFLFSEAREEFGQPLASMLEGDGLEEAVSALRAFALVGRETILGEQGFNNIEAIRLHRLVREVAASRCEGEVRIDLNFALIRALAVVFPKGDDDPASWARCAALIKHFQESCAIEISDAAPRAHMAKLSCRVATYFYARANYIADKERQERALIIKEVFHGADHPEVTLGNLPGIIDRSNEVEPWLRLAVSIMQKIYGANDPELAEHLRHLPV